MGYCYMYEDSSGTKGFKDVKKTYFAGMGSGSSVRGRGNYECLSGDV